MSYTKFSHSVCKKIAMFAIAQLNAQLLETSWKSFCSAQEAQCQTPSVVAQQRWSKLAQHRFWSMLVAPL
jgi:hypothetical protein